jgi:serine/threonine-protein kinase
MPDHPSHIDRYELQAIIGRGAMGVVYRALDPVIGRVVALKTISLNEALSDPLREDSLVRFAREARAAGLLSHPNIVTIYDVGETPEGTSSYIAMEFVEGRNLRQMVPHGERMPHEEVLDMGLQIARGLDYAHRRGIVHRDVKPANILVRDDGLVKLADFGVARIESSELTRTGQSVGSPSYIAPEQLLEQEVDGRSDLFSLGVILYELLTGVKPFRGETIAALYHQVLAIEAAPPSCHDPEIPPEWDAIVLKLLQKSPERRYASAGQVIEDLRRLEMGRPLLHALESEALEELLVEEDSEATVRIIPETVLERVIQQDAESSTASRAPAMGFPPHLKALMALLTIAGFALVVIAAAAFLRQTDAPLPGATPAADQSAAPPAAPPPVDLTVRLAHNIREGRVTMTMDGKPLFAEPLHGERTRLRMQGALSRHLKVTPGKHAFKVVVQDDGGRAWNGTATREIEAGSDPTLFVELKGIVRKSLDLTWY